jgi:hypothetical protein
MADVAEFPDEEQPRRKKTGNRALSHGQSVSDMLKKQAEFLDPLRSVRSALAQIESSSVHRLLREQFSASDTAARRFREMSGAADLLRQQQQTVALTIAERYAALTEDTTNKFFEQVTRQGRALEEASRVPRDMQRWVADLVQEQSFAGAIAQQWQSSTSEVLKAVERSRNPLAGLATNKLFESIAARARQFEEAQRRSTSSEAVVPHKRVAEASQTAQTIVVEASHEPTLQGALNQILVAVHATQDTTLQRLLWFVLVPLLLLMLAAVVNPLADHYIKRKLSESSQGAEKQVRERAAQTVGDLSALSEYRFVRTDVLTVRVGPKAKAPAVGQLRFGQAVLVLEKRGAFTQVLWTSSDGASQVKGWVFSRHLRKFG